MSNMKSSSSDLSSLWRSGTPSGWRVKRLKLSIRKSRNGVWGDEPDGSVDDVRCIRVADFDRQHLVESDAVKTFRKVRAYDRANHLLSPGDLLLEKSGGGEKSPVGFVVRVKGLEAAVCSNFIARMQLADGMDPRFWTYVHAFNYSIRLTQRSIKQTSGIQNLDQQSYFNELAYFPPEEQQRSIADFLDRETAQIDELIDKQTALIELLGERRKAVITQAVTKGLDPKVMMKESGIGWAGAVPASWQAGNIRRFAKMKTGHTPSRSVAAYWENCDIPWFTLADVWQLRNDTQTYLGETASCINKMGLDNSSAELLPTGTVVLSRTASVGFSGVMPRPMATSQDYWNWICGDALLPQYLLYVFRSMRAEFGALMTGSTHQTIYQSTAAGMSIPVPPKDEQRQIVDYLDGQTRVIDVLSERAQRLIELSRERRSALITAAVTGKIDVRGVA